MSHLAALKLTTPMGIVPVQHFSHHSFNIFHPAKKHKAALIYVSDLGNGSVEVYDYPSGTEVGSATGFSYPYGDCSDKHGNAYVTDFDNGTVTKFAYGSTSGTTVASGLATPIGCSVDKKGDLAVTQFEGAEEGVGTVIIYPAGSSKGTAYTGPEEAWPAAFDSKGNLYVEGEDGTCGYTICVAVLPAGSSTFSAVTLNGASIGFPAAVEREQKGMVFGDQGYEGNFTTALYSASCSGTTCNVNATTQLTDDCFYSGEPYNDTVQWGEYSKKPNMQSRGKVTQVAGGNLDCSSRFNMWSFPAGGNPTGQMSGPVEAEGATIVN